VGALGFPSYGPKPYNSAPVPPCEHAPTIMYYTISESLSCWTTQTFPPHWAPQKLLKRNETALSTP